MHKIKEIFFKWKRERFGHWLITLDWGRHRGERYLISIYYKGNLYVKEEGVLEPNRSIKVPKKCKAIFVR